MEQETTEIILTNVVVDLLMFKTLNQFVHYSSEMMKQQSDEIPKWTLTPPSTQF